jgi:hypothetical protein
VASSPVDSRFRALPSYALLTHVCQAPSDSPLLAASAPSCRPAATATSTRRVTSPGWESPGSPTMA